MNNSEKRQEIVAEAMTWAGTIYHHQGRIKGVGVDCAMILAEVYHTCGHIPYIDPRPYSPDWHLHREEEKYLGWIEKYAHEVQNPLPGDIALYKFGRCVSHGAIVIKWPVILHSYLHEGVILADGNHDYLAKRFHKFYSIFQEGEK